MQFQLIEKIRNSIPKNSSLADEMADLLGVSPDSVYRRIRGETALAIDEVYKLCDHYKISFDSLCSRKSDMVSFSYKSLRFDEAGFNDYLVSILDHLKQINRSVTKQVIYLAEDLPIFYHFKFPELAAFKMFYWMKSVMTVASFEGKKFDVSIISKEHIETCRQIFETYILVPSVEIWTETTVASMLKQIEYYWESGQFQKKEDALLICERVRQELEFVQRQAELSAKFSTENTIPANSSNFLLYNCELEIGNNCILVKAGESKAVYLTHIAFNKLVTTNLEFCDETEEWLQNLIKKSVLISGTSEKLRYRFFSKAFEQLDKLMAGIK